MNKFYILFYVFLSSFLYGQKTVYLTEIEEDASKLNYYENKLFSGIAVDVFPSGQKKNEQTFKNGLKSGTYKSFYSDNGFNQVNFKDTALINSTLVKIMILEQSILASKLDTTETSIDLNDFIDDAIGGLKKLTKLKTKNSEGKLNTKKLEDLKNYEVKKKIYLISVLKLEQLFDNMKEQKNILSKEENKSIYNPTVKESFDVVNGIKEGDYSEFSSNGPLKIKGFYKEGAYNGEWSYYYDSGKIHGTGEYIMGDGGNKSESSGFPKNGRFGKWKFYFEDGVLNEESEYKNGLMHGASVNYHQNSTVKNKSTFVDGKREGIYTEFYEDGQLHKTIDYKKGNQNGMTLIYHANGELDKKYNYVLGVLNGTYERYNDKGIQILKATTSNDEFNGFKAEYYDDGTLKSEGNFKDGSAVGVLKTFFPSGKIELIADYSMGKVNGDLKKYHENGNLMLDGTYENDRGHGPTKLYYENGQLQISTFMDTNSTHEGHISRETLSYDENGLLTSHLILDNDGTAINKLENQIFENNKDQINRPYSCRCCKRQINGLRNGVNSDGKDFDEYTYKALMGGSVQALMPYSGYTDPHSYLRNEWWKFCSMKCSRTCYE